MRLVTELATTLQACNTFKSFKILRDAFSKVN